jgi:hypothetical protein
MQETEQTEDHSLRAKLRLIDRLKQPEQAGLIEAARGQESEGYVRDGQVPCTADRAPTSTGGP